MYKILALDGGGIKVIYSLRLLERLAIHQPNLLQSLDVIAGVSAGGLAALTIAFGSSASEVLQKFRNMLPDIFEDSWLDDVKDLGNLLGAEYSTKNLLKAATAHFGDATLSQLKINVVIPTVDLDSGTGNDRRWKAKFFNTYQAEDQNEKIRDVAARTAAPPSYFPTYQGYIDGGVIVNNPSMAALCQAIDPTTGKQSLTEVVLLSIGTGTPSTYISGMELDWGISQWARPILPLILDTSVGVADYQCNKLLNDRYHRINTQLPSTVALDDVSRIDDLITYADSVDISSAKQWLTANWK